jgi:hypothetical protein
MFRASTTKLVLSLLVPFAVAVVPAFVSSEALAAPPDAPAAAPAPRTTFSAPFQRYLLEPNGRPMGLMLADGSVVLASHHAIAKDAPVIPAGTKLDIEGVVRRTATGTIVQRAVVKANGAVVADATKGKAHHQEGEQKEHRQRVQLKAVSAAGQVAAIVTGPHGKVHALLLSDGTTATGHGIEGLGLKVGDQVSVAGMGGAYPLGKAMRIEKITLPNGQTRDLPRPQRHAPPPEPGQAPA